MGWQLTMQAFLICLFPITPWFISDCLFYGYFVYTVIITVWKPFTCFAQREYFKGTLWLVLTATPLLFDDDNWWDVALYLAIVVPCGAVSFMGIRWWAGTLLPSTLQGLPACMLPILDLFQPFVTIENTNDETLLSSSIKEVMALEPSKLKGGVTVSYKSGVSGCNCANLSCWAVCADCDG